MFPEGVYKIGQKELERWPGRILLVNQTRSNTGAMAVGHVFYPGDQATFLVIQSLTLTVNIQANVGAETRVIRQRVEMLDIASGATLGSVWDIQTRDVAGEGLIPDASGLKLALPALAGLQGYSWNPNVQGVIVPPGVSLRHQSFAGGASTGAHGLITNMLALVFPTGTLGR